MIPAGPYRTRRLRHRSAATQGRINSPLVPAAPCIPSRSAPADVPLNPGDRRRQPVQRRPPRRRIVAAPPTPDENRNLTGCRQTAYHHTARGVHRRAGEFPVAEILQQQPQSCGACPRKAPETAARRSNPKRPEPCNTPAPSRTTILRPITRISKTAHPLIRQKQNVPAADPRNSDRQEPLKAEPNRSNPHRTHRHSEEVREYPDRTSAIRFCRPASPRSPDPPINGRTRRSRS